MEIDLPSIKSEIIDPKWDLPKPIPQKNQLIISVESIEPTPPVTPEEVEEKEEKDEMKDTISESGNSIPSIEEITQEFEEEKTKIGKVIVITRIEEEIREKVADVEQRKEPESSSKRAHSKDRKSLPLKRRKALEMSDYDGKCQWADCGHGSEGTNQLYDHVINEHIVPLSTFCSATPSTSGISSQSREGSVSSEISLKQILRKRRSSPVQCSDQGIDSDSDEIDPLGCQWADCEMCLTRGDSDRKYQWLRDHFRTRHAKGAQTYKCILEGCNARFHTNRQLEDHVRLTHIQPANANSHRKDRKSGDIWKKMLKELPSDFPLGKNPYYSSFHHAQLVGHARRLEKCRSGVMLEFKSKKSAHGSAWRKIKIFSQPRLSIVYENSSVFKVPQMPIKSEMNEEKVDERSLSSADFKQRLYALKPSAVLLSLDDLFNA
ncbi:unnamed protein product, partial [Mesorhabditis belari]|uniref:C2H2-type domain-containing protein n=1 Tax=Mesorhabditis belari TaxID=2138241 RepID=A0AAF3J271_9BILA